MVLTPVNRIDLLQTPAIRRVLTSRWPFLLVRATALGFYLLVIVAGFAGTPVGSRNVSIVLVWIAWWVVLMVFAIPLLGRAWCSICPLPMPGEWWQQGGVLGPQGEGRKRRALRWPRQLRHTWLQNAAFVAAALFAVAILTNPWITSAVLLVLLLVATSVGALFERRMFCRHVCPIGGFIGLYSRAAPLALRVKDPTVCAKHTDKSCLTGSRGAHGCPWNVYPAALVTNVNCGLCMECVRACPHDNVGLEIQPIGEGIIASRGRRLDEAFKALLLVGSAAAYAAIMLGPWAGLKQAALDIGSLKWLGFLASWLIVIGGIVPLMFFVAVRLGMAPTGRGAKRQAFVRLAYSAVPLGLAAWIAFSISFALANGSYLWPVLSDPLGKGWNLLGTADVPWHPFLTGYVQPLQAVTILAGLGWSCMATRRLATEASHVGASRGSALPVLAFHVSFAVLLLWLLVG